MDYQPELSNWHRHNHTRIRHLLSLNNRYQKTLHIIGNFLANAENEQAFTIDVKQIKTLKTDYSIIQDVASFNNLWTNLEHCEIE
jgi:collagenase-like PrtC family protease